MPRTHGRPPSYRRKIVRGKEWAVVTLRDADTGVRRDHYLGPFGSPESREAYARLIIEWERGGRRVAEKRRPSSLAPGPTITEICHDWWMAVGQHYSAGEQGSCRLVIRLLRELYGSTSAADFGPKALRTIREQMVAGGADGTRRPWARRYVNAQVVRVRGIFRWAGAHEFVSTEVWQGLRTLEPLRSGRTPAAERPPVKPAPIELIEAARKHLCPRLVAMIDLQLATGMRPGEVCIMRPADVVQDGEVMVYRPQRHKTEHFGRSRLIYLGPQAQKIMAPYLLRFPEQYCFSPEEADEKRRADASERRETPLTCGNRPGTHRSANPQRRPGAHWTTSSYGHAITRACDRAFPPPPPLAPLADEQPKAWKDRLRQEGILAALLSWRQAHRFHPHQLRHNYATEVRKKWGLEAAQILLGHASAQVTEAVYAERDSEKARVIALQMG